LTELQDAPIESLKEHGEREGADADISRWQMEITLAKKYFEDYWTKCDRIYKRFRDERDSQNIGSKYNSLWSIMQTLQPATYSRTPKTQAERKFKDKDSVGRLGASLLERASQNDLVDTHFDRTMIPCRDDFLLIARAQGWVSYKSTFKTIPAQRVELQPQFDQTGQVVGFLDASGQPAQVDPSLIEFDGQGYGYTEPEREEVDTESVPSKYLHYRDFLHNPCRSWDEVRWVAQRVFLTRDEGEEKFGEIFKSVPLDYKPDDLKDNNSEDKAFSQAIVWEIWDKESKRVIFVSESYKTGCLKVLDDPLGLPGFFPCPRPVYGTTTNDSLIPIPDYVQYQDLANELDIVTDKIAFFTRKLKLVGGYNAANKAIPKMFDGGEDIKLVPIDDWIGVKGEGGTANAVEWMPIEHIAQILELLYQRQTTLKGLLDEISSMSDVLRGYSDPNTTATAENIKSQYATLRLADKQKFMEDFARDIIQIKCEIMAKHFSKETFAQIAGLELMEPQAAQDFDAAIELLKNDELRSFRISVETDSTISVDENADKQAANEFITAVGGYFQNVAPIMQQMPQMSAAIKSMLLMTARRYRAGRQVEADLEEGFDAYLQEQQASAEAAKNNPPPPDPQQQIADAKAQEAQAKAGIAQQDLQIKAQKVQGDQTLQAQKQQGESILDAGKMQQDAEIARAKLSLEAAKIRGSQALAEQQAFQNILSRNQ
jgi:hypothetical protein